ncbi:MAG: hypothetical protein EAY75_08045 [Bacteroidetes bacterium]|nr:MAG: hypothetical protein EAY75_08045 [Bacteroidota bacterium]
MKLAVQSKRLRFLGHTLLVVSMVFGFWACGKKGGGTPTPPPPVTPITPVWDVNANRGVWVTTAASTALESRNNIKEMVTTCKRANINNIFVVVYNNARTQYPSTVMQNLIGVPIQEKFAGRDPLQEVIDEAKPEGIKVHAWFEYGFSSSFSASGGPILAARPNWAARDFSGALTVKNGFDWLNGFDPEVQNFMLSLIKEVVSKYNIDGVQGDDRLPALPSTAGYEPYTVALYKSEHGGADPPGDFRNPAWIAWRTNKLNRFMKRIYQEVKALKPTVLVTASPSPFPWAREEYLQDWPTWADSGWIDAVMPQCYRYNIADYNATLLQQKSFYRNPAVAFFPGVLLKVGSTTASDGLLTQMIQSNRNNGFKGETFFFYEGLKDRMSWFQGQYPFIK